MQTSFRLSCPNIWMHPSNMNADTIKPLMCLSLIHILYFIGSSHHDVFLVGSGFDDSNYFGDCFKRIKGMSPREYRKANGVV